MYTVQDICDRYGVTEHTVLHWLRSGQLRGVNVGRTPGALKPRWRVTDDAIRDFEMARSTTAPVTRARRAKKEKDVIQFYT